MSDPANASYNPWSSLFGGLERSWAEFRYVCVLSSFFFHSGMCVYFPLSLPLLCLIVCLSVSVCLLFVSICVCLSDCACVCLPVCLPVLCKSECACVQVPACLCVCVFVFISKFLCRLISGRERQRQGQRQTQRLCVCVCVCVHVSVSHYLHSLTKSCVFVMISKLCLTLGRGLSLSPNPTLFPACL